VSSLEELTPEIIGNCNVSFLYCPKCTSKKVLASFWEECSCFPWCLSLSCGTCKFIWMTCKVCTQIKSHFCFGSDLLWRHKEKHHSDAKSPTKRLLVKQDVEDVDVKLQKLSNSPVDKSTMKQSLDSQKVNDADDDPPNLSSSSIDMPTMKQLLAKHHAEDLPNLSTIIEIPICQEPDAVGVEEVNPKLGEEPMLESSFTGITQGYSDPHVSSAFLNDNVEEVDPKLGEKPTLESSFTGIMQGYSDHPVSSAFLNDNDSEFSESTKDDTQQLCAALSDGLSLPPLLIVDSDMFDISVSTFVDHRVFKVDCDHLDIIDNLYANFCSIPESRFVGISDTKIKQYSVGCDYSLLFKKNHWDDFLDLFKPKKKDCKLHDLDHLDHSKLYITAMFTYGDMEIPQWPHINYSWDVLLLDNRRRRGVVVDKGSKGGLKQGFMPDTWHMPLTPAEGSYVYTWFRRGLSCPIHIQYGHILCLSGDAMRCGGLPTLPNGLSYTGNRYERLHFYFLTNAGDLLDNTIF